MFSRVPYLLFLLMKTICSIASSSPDTIGTEILPSHGFELNGISLPSETQGGATQLDIDATDPTKYAWESSEAPLIIQGNNDQCPYDYNNQNSRRKSRSKRADSSCSPLIDNGQPAVQDSTDWKKTRPGFQWQIVPQTTTENGSGNQKPGRQAPYSDQNRCPRTAPFPVCAFSTVATIRPDPSYPDTGSTVGRWILDYCRFPKLGIGCDRNAGEGLWCCQFASEADLKPDFYPLLRISYPDEGRSCIKIYTFPPPPP